MTSLPRIAALLPALLLLAACSRTSHPTQDDLVPKVELNLTQLDENGLRGSGAGKVSVAYEFSIPNTEDCKAQVHAIDPSVQFIPGSRGRVGAGPAECLCIGDTHQPDYRQVLARLAKLPFVHRIIQCDFE